VTHSTPNTEVREGATRALTRGTTTGIGHMYVETGHNGLELSTVWLAHLTMAPFFRLLMICLVVLVPLTCDSVKKQSSRHFLI
jgi:hypothetical protein